MSGGKREMAGTPKDAHAHHSVLRERTVEHLFVGEVLRALWRRGVFNVEVLRSEFDAHGYDVVMTRGRVTRHIQLKTGKATLPGKVSLARSLAQKPSGCAIWIQITPELELGPYFFFGAKAGKPLPAIDHLARPLRATHNKDGVRPERSNHRLVPRAMFQEHKSIDEVIDALFGSVPAVTIADVVRGLVRAGRSNAEIWKVIQPKFHLDEDKRYYPAWYRGEMKRKNIR